MFDQVAHTFYIMFTGLHFYLFNYFCPFITLFTLASNVFCASVSRYKYFVPSSSQILDLDMSEFCQCS